MKCSLKLHVFVDSEFSEGYRWGGGGWGGGCLGITS